MDYLCTYYKYWDFLEEIYLEFECFNVSRILIHLFSLFGESETLNLSKIK